MTEHVESIFQEADNNIHLIHRLGVYPFGKDIPRYPAFNFFLLQAQVLQVLRILQTHPALQVLRVLPALQLVPALPAPLQEVPLAAAAAPELYCSP